MPAAVYSAMLFGRTPNDVVAVTAPVSKQRFDRIRAAAAKRGLTMSRGRTLISSFGQPRRFSTWFSYKDESGYCFAHVTIGA